MENERRGGDPTADRVQEQQGKRVSPATDWGRTPLHRARGAASSTGSRVRREICLSSPGSARSAHSGASGQSRSGSPLADARACSQGLPASSTGQPREGRRCREPRALAPGASIPSRTARSEAPGIVHRRPSGTSRTSCGYSPARNCTERMPSPGPRPWQPGRCGSTTALPRSRAPTRRPPARPTAVVVEEMRGLPRGPGRRRRPNPFGRARHASPAAIPARPANLTSPQASSRAPR